MSTISQYVVENADGDALDLYPYDADQYEQAKASARAQDGRVVEHVFVWDEAIVVEDFTDIERCRACNDDLADSEGEGWNGFCGECADRREKERTAHFTAQAWINDNAVDVDAEGDSEWFCTDFYWALDDETIGWYEDAISEIGIAHDFQDLLKDDPTAPDWVRNWDGPFRISVRRTHNEDLED